MNIKRALVVKLLNNLIRNETISRKVEQSIYNFVIHHGNKHNVLLMWGNKSFDDIYSIILNKKGTNQNILCGLVI